MSSSSLRLSVLGVGLLYTLGAHAQSLPLERNLPPQVARPSSAVTIGTSPVGNASPAALGINLRAVRLIGRTEPVAERSGAAVSIGGIGIGQVPEAQLQAAIRPFVGKPLSMALIADIQSSIAGVYKKEGYPFVSVTIPPQEITSGVLNLRVVEFGFGAVKTRGGSEADAAAAKAQIRAVEGGRIETASVNEDLRWLNRYPYAKTQGIFSPGDGVGQSDLTLDITSQKPWQVFTGYANTGTPGTDRDRIFFGAGFGLPWLNDAYGSWQTTGSPNLFDDLDRLFLTGDGRADYLSHSARFVLPTLPRQAIEISPSFVATRQHQDLFTFDNNVFELPVYYRSAVSNFVPGAYDGDVSLGFEFKSAERSTSYSGIKLGSARADIFQFGLGWDDTLSDRLGTTSISLMTRFNPGGIVSDNGDDDWNTYSNGRVDNATYAYLNGTVDRDTDLSHGLSLHNELNFQLASTALPDTEQMTLGGLYAVRGYNLNNAPVDNGLVLRNELHFNTIALGPKGTLSPFALLDAGVGRDIGLDHNSALAGVGAGFDVNLQNHLTMNLTAAFALANAGDQKAGDFNLNVRIFASY
ncbi:MAG: ShlB/FhaC/HecB family hemolysin secretion/activation protein [Rhizobiaceae bacterium]|nr:ShlB/FhaC/HecB family hemolysin secretion/activation protein [Rhizobiaceae bacterium]